MLLYLYTMKLPRGDVESLKDRYRMFTSRQLAVTSDKYGVLVLRDYVLDNIKCHIKQQLSLSISKDAYTAEWIEFIGAIWLIELQCFAEVKAAAVEELAKVAGRVIERDDLQALLVDNKDFNLNLMRAVSKRADSVTS